ncbi:hypothetical protein G6F46_015563 [Rhizopus delemar]|nr:hypothetical protein G6F46_015563 [Rhizopus delemar]
MAPRLPPANSTLSIGTPVARLFFEPQNTMAISSSRVKRRRRAMKVISGMAMPSSTAATTATASSESSGVLLHRPSVTASPNAEYTTSRIVA